MEAAVFFLLLIIFLFWDIRAMIREKLKKEMVPYLVFMFITIIVGIIYFSNPYGNSIVYYVLKIFSMEG